MKVKSLTPCFVESFPDSPEEGKLYLSIRFRTAMHLCCCGCGNQVVTPIRPHDWTMSYNGEAASLYPSIGNWSLQCRSHYWITKGKVVEAEDWSNAKIDRNREVDLLRKESFNNAPLTPDKAHHEASEPPFWRRIIARIFSGPA